MNEVERRELEAEEAGRRDYLYECAAEARSLAQQDADELEYLNKLGAKLAKYPIRDLRWEAGEDICGGPCIRTSSRGVTTDPWNRKLGEPAYRDPSQNIVVYYTTVEGVRVCLHVVC